jgi:Predicted hydrolase of the alpha/beta superfamily
MIAEPSSGAAPALQPSRRGQALSIPGPVGRLEALLAEPAVTPRGIAVLGHPHPLYGGAMTNKVVHTLAAAANHCGLVALRFNFRGVGASDGAFDEGRGETEDALAATAWLRERHPDLPLLLGGFSFGAMVTLRAARQAQPRALVSVGLPLQFAGVDGSLPPHPECPWLEVHGRDDEIVSYEETLKWLQSYRPPPELQVLEHSGHFFHGRLGELENLLTGFIGRFWPAD